MVCSKRPQETPRQGGCLPLDSMTHSNIWLCQSFAAQVMGQVLKYLILQPLTVLSIIPFLVLPFLQSWTISTSSRSGLRSHVFPWPRTIMELNSESLLCFSPHEVIKQTEIFPSLLLFSASRMTQAAKFYLRDKTPTSILWAFWFKWC